MIRGTSGNDVIRGTGGDDVIQARGGDDVVIASLGNDDVDAGGGNDRVRGGGGTDQLRGAHGDDRLSGGTGNDALRGAGDNDTLIGNSGDDALVGGVGRDVLIGGAGNDILVGGNASTRLTAWGDWMVTGAVGDGKRDEFRITGDAGYGNDTILGFEPGIDVLRFKQNDIAYYEDHGAAGVQLYTTSGGSVFVDGVTLQALSGSLRGTEFFDLPEVPGDTSTTYALEIGGEVRSRVDFVGDENWFQVELQAGEAYQFDLQRDDGSGIPLSDPYFYLYDEAGNLLDDQDDYFGLDSRLYYIAPQDQIAFAAAAGYGSSTGDYVLSVRNISLLDDIPGDTSTAAEVPVGGEARSTIDFPGDDDWFRVELEGGRPYQIDLAGDPSADEPLSDPYLYLYDAAGTLIALNDDHDGLNAHLSYTPTEDELVFASARAYADFGTGGYVLSVTEEAPTGPVLLDAVPAYNWYHGCSPTAAGSVLGYYDLHGYSGLFDAEGWDEVSLTINVQDHISSPGHNAKYDPTPDDAALPVPPTTSIAGFMGTSVDPLNYGWTWVSNIGQGYEGYTDLRGYDFESARFANTDNGAPGGSAWETYVAEIDAGRPVHLDVDVDGDGTGDHSVPGIGYEDRGADGLWYAAYTCWSESETPIWREFQVLASGAPWAVRGIDSVTPVLTSSAATARETDIAALDSADAYWTQDLLPDLDLIQSALASDGTFDEVDAKIYAEAKLIYLDGSFDDLAFV